MDIKDIPETLAELQAWSKVGRVVHFHAESPPVG